MSLQNVEPGGNADAPERITPDEFFEGARVRVPNAVQCVVHLGLNKAPTDHSVNKPGESFVEFAVKRCVGRKPAYFSMAAFNPGTVSRYAGRTATNVTHLAGFWIDIDAGTEKHSKKPNDTYPTEQEARAATLEFIKQTGLTPNYMVASGSGGIHLYYVLDQPVSRDAWIGPAGALVALAADVGFKIDAQCTTDAARIMRAPGSIHQSTGKEVLVVAWRKPRYTLEEFSERVKYVPGAVAETVGQFPHGKYDLSVNGDVVGQHSPYSYKQAATKCGALKQAAQDNGRNTPYPVWILAVRSADLSIEGADLAYEISNGYPDYDATEVVKKRSSLTGGPAGCATWSAAYGVGGPCESCEWHGKISNPAVQLGALADISTPGELALTAPDAVEDWAQEMNQRFAIVRIGGKMVVADFKTPYITELGTRYGLGWLEVGAFRTMYAGRFVTPANASDSAKPRPIADAWLNHLGRRQYEGVVFSPGEEVPVRILNLWQGFGVEPMAGEVSPWLDTLTAMLPNKADAQYVLRWYAWKIQNPGAVPGTILIYRSAAKGTGKDSINEPIVTMFGRHAFVADNPEQIVGRFTGHLIDKAFGLLAEAVFAGDPRQGDKAKHMVTAIRVTFESKGMDPIQGVNRCAYVLVTNHEYVWQASNDERRAVVLDVSEVLRGNTLHWDRYRQWLERENGAAKLLHYLQNFDLKGFNPRAIPKGDALRKQVEQAVLRDSGPAWWHQCLSEGSIGWRDASGDHRVALNSEDGTLIQRDHLRLSYETSAAARGRNASNWSNVSRLLRVWCGAHGLHTVQGNEQGRRVRRDSLPPLSDLITEFARATGVEVQQ